MFLLLRVWQCIKSARFRSFSGPHFLAFELNTERYKNVAKHYTGKYKILYRKIYTGKSKNAGKYRPEKLRIWRLLLQCETIWKSFKVGLTFKKIFAKLRFSPALFEKMLLLVYLVFKIKNKWILKCQNLFSKKPGWFKSKLYQAVTFLINDYLIC